MIKMVNEFKLTVVHFARLNPMQTCACAWIYRWTKKLENQDWATGPPGLWAIGPSGPRSARLWAVGRWATGLLLAKPIEYVIYFIISFSFSSRSDKLHVDSNCFLTVLTVYGQ